MGVEMYYIKMLKNKKC